MIVDRLEKASLYHCLGPRFKAAFAYLQQTDFSRVALEKFELDGKKLFALPQEYDAKPRETGVWEAHRKYIDIQYIVSGREQMGIAYAPAMRVMQEYDAEKDFMLLEPAKEAGQFLRYAPGMFAIFYPHDAHMPSIALERPEKVRKVVMKVAVE